MKQGQKMKIINHLPFNFLHKEKSFSANKKIIQATGIVNSIILHEIIWRIDSSKKNNIDYSGETSLPTDIVSNELGISKKVLSKHIKQLIDQEFIFRRKNKNVNIYRLNTTKISEISYETNKNNDLGKSLPEFYYAGKHASIPKILVQHLGIIPAMVLAELIFTYHRLIINKKIKRHQYFYYEQNNIQTELNLSENQVYRATKTLLNTKLLFIKRGGFSHKNHYLISEENVGAMIQACPKTWQSNSQNMAVDSPKHGTLYNILKYNFNIQENSENFKMKFPGLKKSISRETKNPSRYLLNPYSGFIWESFSNSLAGIFQNLPASFESIFKNFFSENFGQDLEYSRNFTINNLDTKNIDAELSDLADQLAKQLVDQVKEKFFDILRQENAFSVDENKDHVNLGQAGVREAVEKVTQPACNTVKDNQGDCEMDEWGYYINPPKEENFRKRARKKHNWTDEDKEVVTVPNITGITFTAGRTMTLRAFNVLRIIGNAFYDSFGESFSWGAGAYDITDLNRIAELDDSEIKKMHNLCIAAYKDGVTKFRDYKPHLRTLVAKENLLHEDSLADLKTKMKFNQGMRKVRTYKKKPKHIHGQFIYDPANGDWG